MLNVNYDTFLGLNKKLIFFFFYLDKQSRIQ